MTMPRREFIKVGSGLLAGSALAPVRDVVHAEEQPVLVDCHTHFYDPTRPEGIPWPGKDDKVLYRTVLPKHFLEQGTPVGVTKTVVVEASPRMSDNAWLLELAARNPSIVGVVGNLTPGQSEFAGHLRQFAANRLFRGIRIGHDAVQAGLEKAEFLADLRRIAELGLELDINGGPALPADAARLAGLIPDLRIVINHLANLDVNGSAPPREWVAGMRAAAGRRHVFCKVSALVEHAQPPGGNPEGQASADVDFYRPVLDAIWDIFGDERLIYGSNWPVSERYASYKTVFSIVQQYVAARGAAAVNKFFRENAQAAYRYA